MDRFTINDETVLDNQTGLRWQRCSFGQTWRKNNKCQGKTIKLNYFQAQKISPATIITGMWRVPTKNELATTIDTNQIGLKIDRLIFPDVDENNFFFWTSDMLNQTNAWFVDYLSGKVDYTFGDSEMLHNKWSVRLVHVEK